MLYTYFRLKTLLYLREIKDFGLSPILVVLVFVAASYIVTNQLPLFEHGSLILVFLYSSTVFPFNSNRKDREVLAFSNVDPRYFYFAENLVLTIPFFICAIWNLYFEALGIIILLLFFVSVYKFRISITFLKKLKLTFLLPDVAFIAGFRTHWYWHILGLTLFGIGIYVKNYNVSVFGYAIQLVIFGYYYKIIEKKEWIWNYPVSAERYIADQLTGMAKKLGFFSALWILVLLIMMKNADVLVVTASLFLTVFNMMLSKYAKYNNDISIGISQGIGVVLGAVGAVYPQYLILNILFFFFLKKEAISMIKSFFYAED